MSKHFPEFLDPGRAADQGRRFSGSIRLDGFEELGSLLSDTAGDAEFAFEFSRDQKHRACLTGEVRARLYLTCQRCLERMELPVQTEVSIAFVEGLDEAQRLPEALDPELVSDGGINLMKIVEVELLLALPQAPMHSIDECPIDIDSFDESGVVEEAETKSENPFAVLAELQRKE